MAENLLTVQHAADRLDVSPKTVYRLIYAGHLEHRNIGLGKKKPRVRVTATSLERFMAAGVEATHPPAGPSTPPPPPGPKTEGRAA